MIPLISPKLRTLSVDRSILAFSHRALRNWQTRIQIASPRNPRQCLKLATSLRKSICYIDLIRNSPRECVPQPWKKSVILPSDPQDDPFDDDCVLKVRKGTNRSPSSEAPERRTDSPEGYFPPSSQTPINVTSEPAAFQEEYPDLLANLQCPTGTSHRQARL